MIGTRCLGSMLVFGAALAGTAGLRADVPQFRGEGGTGVSDAKNLPTTWDARTNLRWKAALPGRGLSAPVVTGGKVFVTACTGPEQKRLHVLCFDQKTGKQLWERQFWATGTTLCHPKTNMAAPTPATDGKRVVALFATADLVCLDLDGNLQWYRSLVEDYPTVGNNVGMASSPILWKDLVILCLQNAGESFAAGIDKQTGENRWRIERTRIINWVTPVIHSRAGRDELLLQSPQELSAHDPATGKKVWALTEKRFATMPSPTAGGGLVLTSGERFFAIKPGTDKEPAQIAWSSPKLPTGYSSPLYHQGRVYTVSSRGVVNCADARSGDALWSERVEGNYAASPLLADGKLYVVNEDGLTTVFGLEDGKARMLSTNPLEDTILATPVATDGTLFLRSDGWLYCIGQGK